MEPLDGTEDICNLYKDSCVKYIPRRGGNFYGDAIRTGIEESDGDYLIILDADGSHNPKDILRLYDEIKKNDFDVVIGSRYMKGGYTDNNFILRLMSYVLNVTYRLLFKLNVKDVSDSYRIYNLSKLKNIKLKCDNFDIVEEILIRLKRTYSDIKISEIPISFNKRVYGESKRDLFKFIFSYFKTIYRLKKMEKD